MPARLFRHRVVETLTEADSKKEGAVESPYKADIWVRLLEVEEEACLLPPQCQASIFQAAFWSLQQLIRSLVTVQQRFFTGDRVYAFTDYIFRSLLQLLSNTLAWETKKANRFCLHLPQRHLFSVSESLKIFLSLFCRRLHSPRGHVVLQELLFRNFICHFEYRCRVSPHFGIPQKTSTLPAAGIRKLSHYRPFPDLQYGSVHGFEASLLAPDCRILENS